MNRGEIKTVLVDQDNVIAGFDQQLNAVWRANYAKRPSFVRKNFHFHDDYPTEYLVELQNIYNSKGFFESLPVIAGAVEALEEMSQQGHRVVICTSPLSSNPYCMGEKIQWVENNFGRDWCKRLIISDDKTLIRGDLLIDDRPDLRGEMEPTWEHVIYARPYNEHVKLKRRMTWDNWRIVLPELFGEED